MLHSGDPGWLVTGTDGQLRPSMLVYGIMDPGVRQDDDVRYARISQTIMEFMVRSFSQVPRKATGTTGEFKTTFGIIGSCIS